MRKHSSAVGVPGRLGGAEQHPHQREKPPPEERLSQQSDDRSNDQKRIVAPVKNVWKSSIGRALARVVATVGLVVTSMTSVEPL